MNKQFENREPTDPVDCRQIDRLVDGELSGNERRELLLRLESEPDGWRRCALAFLEAQSWRETFAAPASGADHPVVMPRAVHSVRIRRWRYGAMLTALAASIAVAFAAGWALHQRPALEAPDKPIANSGESDSKETAQVPEPAPVDVAANLPHRAEPDANDLLVKRWEELGYRAERQKRQISVELRDGRKVDVPVDEIQLEYVRGRTY
jgi:anti-sigma factor RsiW